MSICLLCLLMLSAACTSSKASTPIAVAATLPPEQNVSLVTIVPSILPSRTMTDVPTEIPATLTDIPTSTDLPTDIPTETALPSETPLPIATSIPLYVDHYYLTRPISRQGIDYVDRTYAYGDTQRGNREVHTGVEFVNPRGTPVLATAGGSVLYAGTDDETIFGPYANYYGNLVVIEHGIVSPEGLTVYTLYAHLDRVTVETGQIVQQGERVGVVGDSGIALGPHLHFEVRVGDPYDVGDTRNPDLWIYPYPQFGTLAGRVIDSAGNLEEGVGISVTSAQNPGSVRYIFTYADDSVNSSAAWGENFTLGDLPEGDYEVLISNRGNVRFRGQITIQSNQTTWIDIQVD